MHKLNEKQRQAAEFMFGKACVIAVPGSGKTLTMTTRIGHLVKSGIPPEKILGLTFTRNAAKAMKDGLRAVLNSQASDVNLSTIHAFCHRLIKAEGRTFEMVFGKRQIQLIRNAIKKRQITNVTVGQALREIATAKNKLIGPEQFRSMYEGIETLKPIADVYEGYEEEKRVKLLLDFSDLLMEAHTFLTESEDLRDRYRQSYPHLLVDEYQDSNPAQMALLNKLAGTNEDASFWVCGDDWQSIYGFTGASVENIIHFNKNYPGSERFILDINYRSTPEILTACQHLISHNKRKIHKQLNTINPEGEAVTVLSGVNEEAEAEKIVAEIMDLTQSRGFAYTDISVLYRANCQSRAIEEALAKSDIPYRIEKGGTFYERHEVVSLLNYLHLIHAPDTERGDDALKTVINIPNRYISHRFVRDLEARAGEKGIHLYEALKTMPVTVGYLRKGIQSFTDLVDSLIKDGRWLEPADMLHVIRHELDYDDHVSDTLADDPEGPVDSLDQLQITAGNYPGLGEFLAYTDAITNGSGENKAGVSLMTIHKAKGLEFPVVFVIGMLEGVLPNAKGDIEEERRIAFVAMSRAMRLLYLTYSRSYMDRLAKPSSFIKEALPTEATPEPSDHTE